LAQDDQATALHARAIARIPARSTILRVRHHVDARPTALGLSGRIAVQRNDDVGRNVIRTVRRPDICRAIVTSIDRCDRLAATCADDPKHEHPHD